ncbi:MAG: enoyl-CoA hydratase-related protein [Rhizomicrobium sp.]
MSTEMSELCGDGIRCDLSERILTITFDRPLVLNAFSYPMLNAFLRALVMADEHPGVGAIIVTGSGRAFSAGTDISAAPGGFEHQALAASNGAGERDFGGMIALKMFRSSKPIIAAVNGAAVGFGSTLVLPMDMRFASEDAYFCFIFTRRGLMPEACSTWFLPRVVGITRAMDWGLSGRMVTAREAADAGLLAEVVAGDKLIARAREAARVLVTSTSPTSLAVSRRAMWSMLAASGPEAAHALESEGMNLLRASADFREAMAGFREKRPAVFGTAPDAAIMARTNRLIGEL